MSTELEELYQELILDHSRRPRNFGTLPNADVLVHGDNPSCGDEIHLGVHFSSDGKLAEIKFSGQGCAISQASASMMTMKLKGKTRAEAIELARMFKELVTDSASLSPPVSGRPVTPEPSRGGSPGGAPKLGDLQLLQGVRKFPQRVKCAMLAWRAIEQALSETASESTVSTEAG